jgi:glycosyltransferase involved in cell wall biosynthesis
MKSHNRLVHIGMVVSNPGYPDDVRVSKEAESLTNNFQVSVVGWDRIGTRKKFEFFSNKHIAVNRVKIKCRYQNFSNFIFRLPFFWIQSLLCLLRLNVDVTHCHDLDVLPIGIFIKILKPRTKVIFDVHEHYPSMISVNAPQIVVAITSAFFLGLPKFVDGIIVVNDYLLSFFKKSKNIAVVMNTPVLSSYSDCTPAAASNCAFKMFYFGGLSKQRGIYSMMEVAKRLPNVELLIAGEGAAKADVIQYSSKFPNIVYLGWISPEAIFEYASTSDLLPIIYSSDILNNKIATPNKLFMAIALGKPVIVNHGTLTEHIVLKERIGFGIDENSVDEFVGIIKMLEANSVLYEEIKQNCKKSFEKYNWSVMSDRLLRLYEQVLSSH